MKKKSLQKALALAVAAVMSLGTLAGCGSSETTTESAAPAEIRGRERRGDRRGRRCGGRRRPLPRRLLCPAEGGGMDSWEAVR